MGESDVALIHQLPDNADGRDLDKVAQSIGEALKVDGESTVFVGVGTVAVDPKVIPYYTKMFIQTTNGRRVYGMGTALDCGGAIKGNIVDLWFPTKADCYSWGRRNVTVYILDKKAS